MAVTVRPENGDDHPAVRAVNRAAFESSAEADLVDLLRQTARPLISLVAERNGSVVGHILFSPATFAEQAEMMIMALAPMAVRPQYQGRGIGSLLVRAGLEECNRLGADAVIVLGHPEFYPRFGFMPASRFGLGSEFDVPDEVFMAMELVPGALAGVSGQARYHRAFRSLG